MTNGRIIADQANRADHEMLMPEGRNSLPRVPSHTLVGLKGWSASEVRRQQPRQAVAELHREAAPVHLGERHRPRVPESLVTHPPLE